MKNSSEILLFSDNSTQNVETIIPMQEFLSSKEQEAKFTSPVFYLELESKEQLVLKIFREASFQEFTKIIGEVVAYKVSETLKLELVPETQIVAYNNAIGTVQEYISGAMDKSLYSKFLSNEDNEAIQKLKLFWFILGQWDADLDNLFFIEENIPIAIDNANIANIQKITNYGAFSFVQYFPCKQNIKDQGSLAEPIIIKDFQKNLLGFIESNFKPCSEKTIIENRFVQKPWLEITFKYFIESENLYHDFCRFGKTVPLYFMKKCSQDIFAKFKNLPSIFPKICKDSIQELGDILFLSKTPIDKEITINSLLKDLEVHFTKIDKQINERISMVEDYFFKQIEPAGDISDSIDA